MCDVCGNIIGHNCRCPFYIPPKTRYTCSVCGEGIYNGERYLEKPDGDYVHYDCLDWIPDLMDWVDSDIKIMEDNYE